MLNKKDVVIRISKTEQSQEARKIREDAFEVRKKVFLQQGRHKDFIFDEYDQDKETIFITCYLKKDGQLIPIGSIRSFIEAHENHGFVGRISKIAVLPEYRNHKDNGFIGIANNLLKVAENLIIERTKKPIFLLIKALPAAVKFYEKMGYEGNEQIEVPEEPEFPDIMLYKKTPSQLNNIDFEIEVCSNSKVTQLRNSTIFEAQHLQNLQNKIEHLKKTIFQKSNLLEEKINDSAHFFQPWKNEVEELSELITEQEASKILFQKWKINTINLEEKIYDELKELEIKPNIVAKEKLEDILLTLKELQDLEKELADSKKELKTIFLATEEQENEEHPVFSH